MSWSTLSSLNSHLYKLSRPIGGLQVAKYLTRNHPKILMYHRISRDGACGTISIDQFEEQMKVVKRYFNPLSIENLMKYQDKGIVPKYAVSITFDDGYHDFSDYAFPILERFEIPATLFVTTGFINGEMMLWPDQIRYAIENCKDRKKLTIQGLFTEVDPRENPDEMWKRIAEYCLTINNLEKTKIIRSVYDQLGVVLPKKVPEKFRPLNWDVIREMVSKGLAIGSHSHSHPILTKINRQQLVDEIEGSAQIIEEELGFHPEAFCYPNGMQFDFNDSVKKCVEGSNYKYALAAYPGVNPLRDRWAINRYPSSYSFSNFEKHIFGYTMLNMKAGS